MGAPKFAARKFRFCPRRGSGIRPVGVQGCSRLNLVTFLISLLLLTSIAPADFRIPGTAQAKSASGIQTTTGPNSTFTLAKPVAVPPTVDDTLLLWNNTLESGDVTQTDDGLSPSGIAYDSNDSLLYVVASGVLSTVNTTDSKVVRGAPGGGGPGIGFDPHNGYIYEGDESGDVFVFDASNDSLVGKVALMSPSNGNAVDQPAVLYDSVNHNVYIPSSSYTGNNTVFVINSTTDTVTTQIAVGTEPTGIAYDPVNADIYVGNVGSSNVSIIDATTNLLVGSIPVPGGPGSIAYDPTTGLMYVADTNSDNVSIIDPVSNSVTGNITTGFEPDYLTVDTATGEVYVSDDDNSNLTVIDPTSRSVATYVPLGAYAFPMGLVYDPSDSEIYVAANGQNGLAIVNPGTDTKSGFIPTGVFATAAVVVPNGCVYVGSGNPPGTVFVVATSNDSEIKSLSVPGFPESSESLAYDSVDGAIYVADSEVNVVSIINVSTNTIQGAITIPNSPISIAVDNVSGDVYVTNGGNVTVIAPFTSAILSTVPVTGNVLVYDYLTNDVYVASGSSNVVYAINATSNAIVGSILLPENREYPPLSVGIAFDPDTGDLYVSDGNNGVFYVASPYTDQVLATDGGGGGFATFDGGTGYIYDATINATPGSTNGSLNVLDPFNNTFVSPVPVGWQPQAVGVASSLSELFVTSAAEGSVAVLYAPAVPPPAPQSVTFRESGLPNGTEWSVLIDGTNVSVTKSNFTVTLNDGIHTFSVANAAGFEAVPSGGVITVDGSPLIESISFVPPYSVTFTESGLPSGTSWSVTLEGAQQSSSSATISFTEPNGTFSYTVGEVPGYVPSPSSGSVTVDGAAMGIAVSFALATYSVTFPETGLPAGTSWSLTLDGVEQSSTGSSISFTEPNGSWAYSIADVSGWHQTTLAYNGYVDVNGAAVTEPTLGFTEVTYPVTFTEAGLLGGTTWYVNVSGGQSFTSTTSSIVFVEPNGTDDYNVATSNKDYAPTFASGVFRVNGSSASESVSFTLVTFSVTLTEGGLPTETEWWINVTGQPSQSSTTATMDLFLPNGTYSFTVATANKSYWSPGGTFPVTGAAFRESLTFTLVSFNVTLREKGLPTGTEWRVALTDGENFSSIVPTLVFSEPNGTYSYTISAPGFASIKGGITINGASPSLVTVDFVPTQPAGTTMLDYAIIVVAGAMCILAVLTIAWRARRRVPPKNPRSPPSQPGSVVPPNHQ